MSRQDASGPALVVADADGQLFDVPELEAVARSGGRLLRPDPAVWQPIPQGALLFHLPGRRAVGWDADRQERVVLEDWHGQPVTAAAVFLPPAYTMRLLASWETEAGAAPLPLYAYCGVGFRDGEFVVPALRVDPDRRQDVATFDEEAIQRGAERMLAAHPGNRLVDHLVNHCALDYCCPAARNFVLGRFEAPLPTSPACNAQCVGCISLQPDGVVPVTQPRLSFVPSVEEIVAVGLTHLENVPERAVLSFGQGCEGEPMMQADLITESIGQIRRQTDRGTININTNASKPDAVRRMVEAGLDSIRISLNSAQPELYRRYYRPHKYGLEDVAESGRVVSEAGGLVTLNYFIFPGLTDTEAELAALETFIEHTGARFIQMRNLNIDPDMYLDALGFDGHRGGLGVDTWMQKVRERFPALRFGYFNPPKETWPPKA
jgi:pyruvate-formate lyase-activating enzyme